MRYLILSDIHANLTALEAALDAARGRWDKAVCLGDLVGYGPDPNQVTDRIRKLNCVTIRGNHDKAVTGLINAEDFNPVARGAVVWTREHLRDDNFEYLKDLPHGPMPTGGFQIIHGAYHDEDEYVFVPEQAAAGLRAARSAVMFFGHTHMQGGFTLRGHDVGALYLKPGIGDQVSTLRIEIGTTYLLNPGSIGQPRDGDSRAAFAIADLDHQMVQFWRVPYQIENVQERMMRAGFPEPLVLRLAFGR